MGDRPYSSGVATNRPAYYRRLPQSVADLVEIGTVPVIEISRARSTVRVTP